MDIPTLDNINKNGDRLSLNKLAITKTVYPVYFYINTTKALAEATDLTADGADIELTIVTGSGLVAGDYFKIATTGATPDDEVFRVIEIVTDDTVIKAARAQLGSSAEVHTKDDDICIQSECLTEVELNGADDPIPESQVVLDIGDAQFYDISIGFKIVNVTDDNSGAIITLYYAFSNDADIPLTDAGATSLALSKTTAKAITLPNGTLDLYYTTNTIKPLARYMYIWAKSNAAVVLTNGCDYYVTINTV